MTDRHWKCHGDFMCVACRKDGGKRPFSPKLPKIKCSTCQDAGQIVTGTVDPDNPWAAPTHAPCPNPACKAVAA